MGRKPESDQYPEKCISERRNRTKATVCLVYIEQERDSRMRVSESTIERPVLGGVGEWAWGGRLLRWSGGIYAAYKVKGLCSSTKS